MLTLIETEKIDKLVAKHMEAPENRGWQKILAYKVVEIIHGSKEADLAVKISDFMFGWEDRLEVLKSLSDTEIETFQNAMWGFKYSWENLFETIVKSWLESSNSNARNAVKSWAIYINEEKIEDFNFDVSSNFINDKVLLIRKGKKNFRIITK
jgi:tyrosyl-tRNA synthetase